MLLLNWRFQLSSASLNALKNANTSNIESQYKYIAVTNVRCTILRLCHIQFIPGWLVKDK